MFRYIKGYGDKYRVYSCGRITRKVKESELIYDTLPFRTTSGYVIVTLFFKGVRKDLKVHRIVADAFILNPDSKTQVNHINGVKTDNRIENLEWCTAKENTNHAIEKGLKSSPVGESNVKAKLTEKMVKDIRKRSNESSLKLAKEFGVNKTTILNVRNFKTWKHVK